VIDARTRSIPRLLDNPYDEASIKDGWNRLVAQRRMVAFRRRFAPQIAYIQARLSPTGRLGLHLVLGALVLIGAGWLFGGIAEDVVNGDPLTVVDAHIATWFHAHAVPTVTLSMLLITNLHGTWGITILSLVMSLFLIWKRAWDWLLALVLVVPGGMLLNVLMKHAFGRARPMFSRADAHVDDLQFPERPCRSGHLVLWPRGRFYGYQD
jgi:hypothetical protein